jgi:hypothetical protein
LLIVVKSGSKAVVVFVVFLAAVYASSRAAVPDPLLGVALGWAVLLHIERGATLFGAIGLVVLVGWRALSGEFPVKLGNVEYAVGRAVAEAEEASASQERRIRLLEVLVGARYLARLDDDD